MINFFIVGKVYVFFQKRRLTETDRAPREWQEPERRHLGRMRVRRRTDRVPRELGEPGRRHLERVRVRHRTDRVPREPGRPWHRRRRGRVRWPEFRHRLVPRRQLLRPGRLPVFGP